MRLVVHVLLSIALWVVFVVYWDLVTRDAVGPGTLLAIQVLSVLVVAGTIVTAWWVVHNLRLGRRDRRRAPRPVPAETLTADALGRPVDAPPLAQLRTAGVVEISVDDARKSYRPVTPDGIAGSR